MSEVQLAPHTEPPDAYATKVTTHIRESGKKRKTSTKKSSQSKRIKIVPPTAHSHEYDSAPAKYVEEMEREATQPLVQPTRVRFTIGVPASKVRVHPLFAPKKSAEEKQKKRRLALPLPAPPPPLTEPEEPEHPIGKTHNVTIYIDSREAALRQIMAAAYADTPKTNLIDNVALPVADIRIDCDGHPCVLIERKDINDFISSLYDGRFREQRSRLLDARKENPNLILIFAFEGSLDAVPPARYSRFKKPFVENMARDLTYKYNIHELWFATPVELLTYIGHIERVYEKYGPPKNIITENTITDQFHIGKKRELDSEQFNLLALTMIKGVSANVSKVIMEKYKILPDLIKAYSKIRGKGYDEKRKLMLADLTHGNAERRIGNVLSTRIYMFLYNKPN